MLAGSIGFIGLVKKKMELKRGFLNPTLIKERCISQQPIKIRRRKRQEKKAK